MEKKKLKLIECNSFYEQEVRVFHVFSLFHLKEWSSWNSGDRFQRFLTFISVPSKLE